MGERNSIVLIKVEARNDLKDVLKSESLSTSEERGEDSSTT